MRKKIRQFLWEKKARTLETADNHFFQQSAVVFSPHQDDETLGCGGLIIKKKIAGAPVKIVLMTDGRRSHAKWIPVDDLVELRRDEAIAAAKILGVDHQDVIHLGFKDGRLSEHIPEASQKVYSILQETRPVQVFLPYAGDKQTEHQATHRIIRDVLDQNNLKTEVYAYPIWFWNHWPWVEIPSNVGRRFIEYIKNSLEFGGGLRFWRDFNFGVPLAGVLETKQAALNQYKTQMTRYLPGIDWPTLGGVSKGEFLQCFFREYELYHRCGRL